MSSQANNAYKAFFSQMSDPRMKAYGVAFRTKSDQDLLGAYLWAQATSAAFQPFISLAEVTLRNAIHTSLSLQTSGFHSDSYPWYDSHTLGGLVLNGRTEESVRELLFTPTGMRRNPQPAPDKVVSELSFGVWSDVLASQLTRVNQARTFTDVFTNHPNSKPAHWSHGPNRVIVVDRVKKLQRLRNRVSHFEPVWSSSTFQGPMGGRHWSFAVQALSVCKSELVELLEWISQPSWSMYKSSFARQWLDRLVTTKAVQSFMFDPLNTGHLAAAGAGRRPCTASAGRCRATTLSALKSYADEGLSARNPHATASAPQRVAVLKQVVAGDYLRIGAWLKLAAFWVHRHSHHHHLIVPLTTR